MSSNVQKKRKIEKQKSKREEKSKKVKAFLKGACSENKNSIKNKVFSKLIYDFFKCLEAEKDYILRLILFHSDNKEGLIRLYLSDSTKKEFALSIMNRLVAFFEKYGITHNSIVANISKTFSTLYLFLKLFNDGIFCKTFSEENGFEVSELCKKKLDGFRLQVYESEIMDDITEIVSETIDFYIEDCLEVLDVDLFNEKVIEKIVCKYNLLVSFIDKHVFNDYTEEEKAVIYADSKNFIQTELDKLKALIGDKFADKFALKTLGL